MLMSLYFNLKNVADARLADNLEDLVVTCMRDDWLPNHSPQHTWQAFNRKCKWSNFSQYK